MTRRYLIGNLLSGSVPSWMLNLGDDIDLSYNNFTFERSMNLRCLMWGTNLFASFSRDNLSEEVVSCLNIDCPSNLSSLHINCGGKELRVGDKKYEGDQVPGGASHFSSIDGRWGFSNNGHFLDEGNRDSYIVTNTFGVLVDSDLYTSA